MASNADRKRKGHRRRWIRLAWGLLPILLVASLAVGLDVRTEQSAKAGTNYFKKYAPAYYFHKNETYWPSHVPHAVASAKLKFSTTLRTVSWSDVDYSKLGARAGDTAYMYDGNFYDHYANECSRPTGGCSPRDPGLSGAEGFWLDLDDNNREGLGKDALKKGDVPLYFLWTSSTASWSGATPGQYLIYVVYFEYDKKAFRHDPSKGGLGHESDWEWMAIKFDLQGNPTNVIYHWHDCVAKSRPWSEVKREGGTHPVVYVAKWSHGMWHKKGTQRGYGKNCYPSRIVDVKTDEGVHWWPWITDNFSNLKERSYYGYGGAWGRYGLTKWTTAPLGPSKWWVAKVKKAIEGAKS